MSEPCDSEVFVISQQNKNNHQIYHKKRKQRKLKQNLNNLEKIFNTRENILRAEDCLLTVQTPINPSIAVESNKAATEKHTSDKNHYPIEVVTASKGKTTSFTHSSLSVASSLSKNIDIHFPTTKDLTSLTDVAEITTFGKLADSHPLIKAQHAHVEADSSINANLTTAARSCIRSFPEIAKTHKQIRYAIAGITSGNFESRINTAIMHYLRGIRKEYEQAIASPIKCRKLAKSLIRTTDLLHCLCSSLSESEDYMHRMSEIVAFCVSCDLCAAKYEKNQKIHIANRIGKMIKKYLKSNNNETTNANILRMLVVIPKLFGETEIMSKIFDDFIPQQRVIIQQELPDKVYIQYIIVFYQWKQLQLTEEAKDRIIEYADKFMRPAVTLCSNTIYAYHLPKYAARRTATSFILENLKFYEDLRNASLFDNKLKCAIDIIDLSEDEVCGCKHRTLPLQDFKLNKTDICKKTSDPIKLEKETTIASIDLTLEDATNVNYDAYWLNTLMQNARKSELNKRSFAVFRNNQVTNAVDVQWKESPTTEPIVVDLDSEKDMTGKEKNNDESEMFALDFDCSMIENCDVSFGESDRLDPTQLSLNLPINLRTYSASSKQQRHQYTNQDFRCTFPEIALHKTAEEHASNLEVNVKPNTSIGDTATVAPSSTVARVKEYPLPNIFNSFSCRRDSIHLVTSPCKHLQNCLNDVEVPEAFNTNHHNVENDDTSGVCIFQKVTPKESNNITSQNFFSEKNEVNSQSLEPFRTEHYLLNAVTESSPVSSKKSLTCLQQRQQHRRSLRQVSSCVVKQSHRKQVKFNDRHMGPTNTKSDLKLPIKSAISRFKLPISNAASHLLTHERDVSCCSPLSSSSSICSDSLKKKLEKERLKEIPIMFSKLNEIPLKNKPSKMMITSNDFISKIFNNTDNPSPKSIFGSCQSKFKPKKVTENNDSKLKQRCRTVIVSRESSAYDVAFINELLEKQRENLRLKALERKHKHERQRKRQLEQFLNNGSLKEELKNKNFKKKQRTKILNFKAIRQNNQRQKFRNQTTELGRQLKAERNVPNCITAPCKLKARKFKSKTLKNAPSAIMECKVKLLKICLKREKLGSQCTNLQLNKTLENQYKADRNVTTTEKFAKLHKNHWIRTNIIDNNQKITDKRTLEINNRNSEINSSKEISDLVGNVKDTNYGVKEQVDEPIIRATANTTIKSMTTLNRTEKNKSSNFVNTLSNIYMTKSELIATDSASAINIESCSHKISNTSEQILPAPTNNQKTEQHKCYKSIRNFNETNCTKQTLSPKISVFKELKEPERPTDVIDCFKYENDKTTVLLLTDSCRVKIPIEKLRKFGTSSERFDIFGGFEANKVNTKHFSQFPVKKRKLNPTLEKSPIISPESCTITFSDSKQSTIKMPEVNETNSTIGDAASKFKIGFNLAHSKTPQTACAGGVGAYLQGQVKMATSLTLLANTAANISSDVCTESSSISNTETAIHYTAISTEANNVQTNAKMLATEKLDLATVIERKTETGLLNIEVATPIVPVYLLNGESRDVPTPTSINSFSEAVTVSVGDTMNSTTINDANNFTETSTSSTFDFAPSLSSTSEYEVSSTQELSNDALISRSTPQIQCKLKLPDTKLKTLILQNNQVDTTHHMPELKVVCYNERRQLRNQSLTYDEHSSTTVCKRRKTFCVEDTQNRHIVGAGDGLDVSLILLHGEGVISGNSCGGENSPCITTTNVTLAGKSMKEKRGISRKNKLAQKQYKQRTTYDGPPEFSLTVKKYITDDVLKPAKVEKDLDLSIVELKRRMPTTSTSSNKNKLVDVKATALTSIQNAKVKLFTGKANQNVSGSVVTKRER